MYWRSPSLFLVTGVAEMDNDRDLKVSFLVTQIGKGCDDGFLVQPCTVEDISLLRYKNCFAEAKQLCTGPIHPCTGCTISKSLNHNKSNEMSKTVNCIFWPDMPPLFM